MEVQRKCSRCFYDPGVTVEQDQFSMLPLHLTRKNVQPSEEEQSALKNKLTLGNKLLRSVNEEIFHMRSALQELERQRTQIETFVNHCESVFAPSRVLDTEILEEIFLYANPELICNGKESLPPLSQVCSYWRVTALNLSQLWSRISIQLLGDACNVTDVLETSLHLSRSHPLFISLNIFYLQPDSPALLKLMPVILGCSQRWRNVSFPTGFHIFLSQYLSESARTLDLTLIHGVQSNSTQGDYLDSVTFGQVRSIDWFRRASCFRNLSLHYNSMIPTSAPWTQITSFEMNFGVLISSFELKNYISPMSGLVDLTVHCSNRFRLADEAGLIPPLVLTRLESLTIILGSGELRPNLLRFIQAPSLNKLAIADHGFTGVDFSMELSAFINRLIIPSSLQLSLGPIKIRYIYSILEHIKGTSASLLFSDYKDAIQFIKCPDDEMLRGAHIKDMETRGNTELLDISGFDLRPVMELIERQPFQVRSFKEFESLSQLIRAMEDKLPDGVTVPPPGFWTSLYEPVVVTFSLSAKPEEVLLESKVYINYVRN